VETPQQKYLRLHPDRRQASVDKYHASHKEEERIKNAQRARKPSVRKKRKLYESKYRQSEKGKYAQRKHKLKKYGITPEQYDKLLKFQSGVCGVCKQPDVKNLAVDHDWVTGKVRGLLCYRCNSKMGQDDSILIWIRNAALYMEVYMDGIIEETISLDNP